MGAKVQFSSTLVIAVLLAAFTSTKAISQGSNVDAKGAQRTVTEVELSISKDGRTIVDQNGKIIARFAKGMSVQMSVNGTKTIGAKMPGCWRTTKDCNLYDVNGKCIRWNISHTWDFDCKTK